MFFPPPLLLLAQPAAAVLLLLLLLLPVQLGSGRAHCPGLGPAKLQPAVSPVAEGSASACRTRPARRLGVPRAATSLGVLC